MKYLTLGLALLVFPSVATAQLIEVDPLSWDFGIVGVGDSATYDFTILSDDSDPLLLNSIYIQDDPTSSFFISSTLPSFPQKLQPLDTLGVEVTFAPTVYGNHFANLHISSNSHTFPEFDVPLSGGTIPEPGTFVIWSILAGGGIGVAWWRRRRRQ
jgi:hypothetical protein